MSFTVVLRQKEESPEGNVITHALHPFSWTLKLESPMSRRRYSFEERLEVVMHYFASDEGYRLT
ncbi:transposase, partial [Klebsiella michiganensis]|uniref:transposase n=1 Tax=Klebsiella michiganensis TaxID=1134687 RepID=UPI001A9C43BC